MALGMHHTLMLMVASVLLTTEYTLLYGRLLLIDISTQEHPRRYSFITKPSNSLSVSFLEALLFGGSESVDHPLDVHMGHLFGCFLPLDTQLYPHLLHEYSFGAMFHWCVPHDGQRLGDPLWEFHTWPQRRQATLRS